MRLCEAEIDVATDGTRLLRWLAVGVWVGAIMAGSLLPSIRPPARIVPFARADLIVHAFLYGVLALLLAWACRARTARSLTAGAVVAFVFGVAIECAQPLTGRTFDPLDIGANGAGALLAAGLGLLVSRLGRSTA